MIVSVYPSIKVFRFQLVYGSQKYLLVVESKTRSVAFFWNKMAKQSTNLRVLIDGLTQRRENVFTP